MVHQRNAKTSMSTQLMKMIKSTKHLPPRRKPQLG